MSPSGGSERYDIEKANAIDTDTIRATIMGEECFRNQTLRDLDVADAFESLAVLNCNKIQNPVTYACDTDRLIFEAFCHQYQFAQRHSSPKAHRQRFALRIRIKYDKR